MNRQIMDIFKNAEGRYLTKAEFGSMREYAQSIEARIKACEEIEQREESILSKLMSEMMRAYPDFEKQYGRAADAGNRDTGLVLRYSAQAMLRNDVEWLDSSLLNWMNTILKGVGLTEGFIRDTYVMMERVCQTELSPETFELVQPYVQRAQAVLSAREEAA